METDSVGSGDADWASTMSSDLSADRVPTALVERKRGDGNYAAAVGVAGASDDRISPGAPYLDRLFAA
jgi:hypothetical protein